MKAFWILWLITHVHGHMRVMQAHVYTDVDRCERAAAELNTTSNLGYFACFRQGAEKPYTY